MRKGERGLRTIHLAFLGLLTIACAHRGFLGPPPPPRPAQEPPPRAERRYDHNVRVSPELADFSRLYEKAGQPAFAVLVNRYPVEGHPALDEMEPVGAVEGHRDEVSTGNQNTKRMHYQSGEMDVEIEESAETPKGGTAESHESFAVQVLVPRRVQPLWDQLNELQVEDAVTSVLAAYGVRLADADTLKSIHPPPDTPSGTTGTVPGAPVQVVVKCMLGSSFVRVSIKAADTSDGTLLAHATRTILIDDLDPGDPEFAMLMVERTTRDMLRELSVKWARQYKS